MESNQYQLEANAFCSPSFYGNENYPVCDLIDALEEFAVAGQKLDAFKRALFYDNREKCALPGDESMDVQYKHDQDIIHSIIGIATEAGEAAEIAVKMLDNHLENPEATTLEYDRVNLMEEAGDLLWYIALGLTGADYTMTEAMEKNIAKLTARYPEKALSKSGYGGDRDLENERAILEGKQPDYLEAAWRN